MKSINPAAIKYINLYEYLGNKICAYLLVMRYKNSNTTIINTHLSLDIKLVSNVEFNDNSLTTVNKTEAEDIIMIDGLITDILPVSSLERKFPIITPRPNTIDRFKI